MNHRSSGHLTLSYNYRDLEQRRRSHWVYVDFLGYITFAKSWHLYRMDHSDCAQSLRHSGVTTHLPNLLPVSSTPRSPPSRAATIKDHAAGKVTSDAQHMGLAEEIAEDDYAVAGHGATTIA